MKNLTFNEFCYKFCDGLYDPKFGYNNQCTGYKELRELVKNKIRPATIEEIKRWETNPTGEELRSVPDKKYLRFLHPGLRTLIIENWDDILEMDISEGGIAQGLKIYRCEFEPIYPTGACLVLAAYSLEEAEQMAKKTIMWTSDIVVNELMISEPQIIEFLDGDY